MKEKDKKGTTTKRKLIKNNEQVWQAMNNNEKKEFHYSVKAVKSLTILSNNLLSKKNKK